MKRLLTASVLVLCLVGATTAFSQELTRQGNYPKMYDAKPSVIVVMPPINQTTTVDAKEYFYFTVNTALCEAGYYVVSPFLAMEMFKAESAYDSELFLERGDLDVFRKIFNADALLFTTINGWEKSKLAGKITVEVDYLLRSVATGEKLFERSGRLTLDTSVNSGGGAGMFGALIDIMATALSTTETGKIRAARNCNYFIFRDVPRGSYDSNHQKDQHTKAGKIEFADVVR